MKTNIELEADVARLMVEQAGKKAFVLIAEISGGSVSMTRSITDGTTRREAVAWIGALNRERERVAKLVGVDPDVVGTELIN